MDHEIVMPDDCRDTGREPRNGQRCSIVGEPGRLTAVEFADGQREYFPSRWVKPVFALDGVLGAYFSVEIAANNEDEAIAAARERITFHVDSDLPICISESAVSLSY